MLTEESFVDFKCPHCGDAISFPQDCAGQVQACPSCMEDVIVPSDGNKVGHKLPLPLTLPTMVLRRLSGEDWKDLMEIMSDEENFTYSEGRPLGEEDVVRWLEEDQRSKLTTPNQPFILGMELLENHKLIGFVSFNFIDQRRQQAALSISVNRTFQRKGFATEAGAAMLDFCFGEIGLHRVTASCDGRNIAGWRLWDSVGLRREGEFVKDRQINGEWANTLFYALIEEEYGVGDEG